MIRRGPQVEGRCTLEGPPGSFDVSFRPDAVRIDPAGPLTVLRALLWMASGRRRRAVRSAARRFTHLTGQPVEVRLAPRVRIPLSR